MSWRQARFLSIRRDVIWTMGVSKNLEGWPFSADYPLIVFQEGLWPHWTEPAFLAGSHLYIGPWKQQLSLRSRSILCIRSHKNPVIIKILSGLPKCPMAQSAFVLAQEYQKRDKGFGLTLKAMSSIELGLLIDSIYRKLAEIVASLMSQQRMHVLPSFAYLDSSHAFLVW